MKVTIEGDAKEIAALFSTVALSNERLIDLKIEEKLTEESRRLAQSFKRFTPSKVFFLELQTAVDGSTRAPC